LKSITLRNGVVMPQLGFGLLQIRDSVICERCVEDALHEGYRLFDTAAAYFNEEAVGRAIEGAGVPRQQLFITTKLWLQDYSYDKAQWAFQASLKRLQLDYIDLYLLHQPFGNYYAAWSVLEKLYQEGLVKAIGVCNFTPERLVDLCLNSEIHPMLNQVELHPFLLQSDPLRIMREYRVQPEAWGPLCEGQKGIFQNHILTKIGEKYGKTAAQTSLRWNIQRGVVVIPKTVHVERMKENMNIWDFSLSEEDMSQINSLDSGESEIINFHSACTAKWLNEFAIHE
jgi:2,5-diketo-D-gluconate reductase A